MYGVESYIKAEVISPPEFLTNLPFSCLPTNYIHMTVKAGSKMKNILGYAIKNFQVPEAKCIVFSGSGQAIIRTISCAEIMKKKFKNLHQINKIEYVVCEEMWEPKIEDLDRLKVKRDIPAMHILLSKVAQDTNEPGYQPPGPCNAFWKESPSKRTSKQTRKPKHDVKRERSNDDNWRKKGSREKGKSRPKHTGGSREGQPATNQVQDRTTQQVKSEVPDGTTQYVKSEANQVQDNTTQVKSEVKSEQ